VSNDGPIDKVDRSPVVVVIAIVANVFGAASVLLSLSVKTWVRAHPFLLYWAVLVLLAVAIGLFSRLAIAKKAAVVEELKLRDQIRALEAGLSDEPHPTARDKKLFEQLISQFPWQRGFMAFIDPGGPFNGKNWTFEDVEPLYDFSDGWRERFFDDVYMQVAFKAFHARGRALAGWFAKNGFRETDPIHRLYAINPAEVIGYEEFAAIRGTGLMLADSVVDARRDLELVGRQRGL
jgi:hypothetical protein